jgi:hypothetical protein
VELLVHGVEALLIDVGVDLGGGNISVTQEFLDDTQIGAVFEQMGGETVAEQVRVDAPVQSGGAGAGLDDLPRPLRGQVSPMDPEEDVATGLFANEFRAFEPTGTTRVLLPLPVTRMNPASRLRFSSRAPTSSETRRPLA